jgi:hypothetical protein
MYSKKDIFPVAMVFNGTEMENHAYAGDIKNGEEGMCPSTFVYSDVDDITDVDDFVKRQKIAKNYLPCSTGHNPWALAIFDDVSDGDMFKEKTFKTYYRMSRHWKLLHMVAQQTPTDVPTYVRSNLNGAFIFGESSTRNRDTIYNNYVPSCLSRRDFDDLMDQLGDDHTAIYFRLDAGAKNTIEDRVFFYKAKETPKNFKFGCQEFWDYHYSRFNKDYKVSY